MAGLLFSAAGGGLAWLPVTLGWIKTAVSLGAVTLGVVTVLFLVWIKSADLPERSYRTYHPNYLWRIGFYEYRDAIVGAINGNG
jgi:hypothetical protein